MPLLSLFLSLLLPWFSVLLGLCIFIYTMLWLVQGSARLLRRLAILAGFVALGALPICIVRSEGADTLVSLWGWGISLDSLHAGGRLFLRCIGASGAMLLLLALTPFYEICRGARSMGIPRLVIELLELTYRCIYVLEETVEQIATAQVARLGYGDIRSRLRHLSMLLSQTFVLTQHQAESIYEGLLSRGYREDEEADDLYQPTYITTMAATPIIRLEDIGFAWEAQELTLRDINLTIGAGERIVLLGANGAGKSTLMNLMAGIRPWATGAYYLSGEVIAPDRPSLRSIRRRVALVFQNANHQLFCPTVADELAFGLRNIGLSEEATRTKVESLIARYELEKLRDKAPHELSEGQKKWVSIVAILALDPEVILLDEPTASLDCYYTDSVMQLLMELNSQGITILLSTHDMELAYDFGERAIVISSGNIVADTTPRAVFTNTPLVKEARLRVPQQLCSRAAYQAEGLITTPPSGYTIPIFLSAAATHVLIVGGGQGAWRKLQGLLARGAQVDIMSPGVLPEIEELCKQGRCVWIQKCFDGEQDIADAYAIVVASTGAKDLDEYICSLAKGKGLLYANMSEANLSNFHFAWGTNVAGIALAIHTDYALPELSQGLGRRLVEHLPKDWASELNRLSALRQRLIDVRAADDLEADRIEHEYKRLLDSLLARVL